MPETAPRPEGQFWKDLRENLKDPEFRETYIAFSREIAAQQPTAPRPDVPDTGLRPMTDQDTALTIAHMNPGVSVTQAEIVIEVLRRIGWLSPAGVAANERQVRERVAAEAEPVLKDLRKAARTHHYLIACEKTDEALARLRAAISGEAR